MVSQSNWVGRKVSSTACAVPASARPLLAPLSSHGLTVRMLKIHRYLTMRCPRARVIQVNQIDFTDLHVQVLHVVERLNHQQQQYCKRCRCDPLADTCRGESEEGYARLRERQWQDQHEAERKICQEHQLKRELETQHCHPRSWMLFAAPQQLVANLSMPSRYGHYSLLGSIRSPREAVQKEG